MSRLLALIIVNFYNNNNNNNNNNNYYYYYYYVLSAGADHSQLRGVLAAVERSVSGRRVRQDSRTG